MVYPPESDLARERPDPRASGLPDADGSRDLLLDTPRGTLFARVWGDWHAPLRPPPIVLIHDSLGSVELWRDFPARLAAATGHPVAAYDRLGFGRSDAYPGGLGAGFISDEPSTGLAPLRAALGIDRMILFGHSVGGAMAVHAGGHFADATAAVITMSAQAFVEDRTLLGLRNAKTAFAEPGQLERLARYHGRKAAWVLGAWIETWLDPAFASWTLDADLRSLRCPVLAIHGDHDEYGSRAHPERIAALVPAFTEVVVIEQCGHVPHREQPERVLEAVRSFLTRLAL